MTESLLAQAPVLADSLGESGRTLLGYVKGVSIALAVIGLVLLAGKMISSQWRDGREAAQAVSELPWLLLALVLLSSASAIVTTLLEPAGGGNQSPDYVEQFREVDIPKEHMPDDPPDNIDTGED